MRALRFVENVYDYMHAADAFVTKPGGLSTAEALVAQVPMVLCKPLPGQEERNARVLVEAGAAVRTRRVDDLPGALEGVLTDPRRRERMVAAARRLGRPDAAGEAASMIARLDRAAKGGGRVNLPSSRAYGGWLAIARILTGVIWLTHGVPKFMHSDRFMPPGGVFATYLQKGLASGSRDRITIFSRTSCSPTRGSSRSSCGWAKYCVGISLVLGLVTRLGGVVGVLLPLNYLAARGALGQFQRVGFARRMHHAAVRHQRRAADRTHRRH